MMGHPENIHDMQHFYAEASKRLRRDKWKRRTLDVAGAALFVFLVSVEWGMWL